MTNANLNQGVLSPRYFVFLHHFYRVSRSDLDDVIRNCHEGLRHVAANDPDHARKLNGVGFSASDQTLGHKLARATVQTFLRSEVLAQVLIKLAIKYRRQIPPGLRFDPSNRQSPLKV
ncbi:hypothetical protein [Rhizobium sp. Kim5]|uniref:hypothetical protein n=1 Tax=Rhizobium sp. Kim5 TaxID=2020311 RepID=UPI0001908341|nr:hypothetical protein [Rhizobium sp. Kim5]